MMADGQRETVIHLSNQLVQTDSRSEPAGKKMDKYILELKWIFC